MSQVCVVLKLCMSIDVSSFQQGLSSILAFPADWRCRAVGRSVIRTKKRQHTHTHLYNPLCPLFIPNMPRCYSHAARKSEAVSAVFTADVIDNLFHAVSAIMADWPVASAEEVIVPVMRCLGNAAAQGWWLVVCPFVGLFVRLLVCVSVCLFALLVCLCVCVCVCVCVFRLFVPNLSGRCKRCWVQHSPTIFLA